MDISIILISLSVTIQLTAAFFAIRLLMLPGRRTTGLLTLTIILLMAFRRFISFYRLITGGAPIDLFAETLALSISFLILVAIFYMTRIIRSERRMASMLEESKQYYQTLFNQSPYGVIIIDLNGHIIDFNDIAASDLGYAREELLRLNLSDIDPVETPEEIQRRIEDISRKGRAEFEVKHKTKGGDIRDVHVITQVIESGGKSVLHAIWRDITEQKQTDRLLRKSEKKYRTLLENIPQKVFYKDKDSNYIAVNPSYAQDFGLTPEEFAGKKDYDLYPPELAAKYCADDHRIMEKRRAEELDENYIEKGVQKTVHTMKVPVMNEQGEVEGILGIFWDITERKKTEEAMSRSEERYRNLFEYSPISLWEEDCSDLLEYLNSLRSSGITDFRSYFADYPEEVYKCIGLVKIISVNKATLDLYEAPDNATLLRDLSQVFTLQSHESFRDILVALAEGTLTHECEAVNKTLTGRTIKVLLRWSVMTGTVNQASHALVSILDVTDRAKTEEMLRRSEEFVRNILNTVDEGFIVIDRDYSILTANKAYCGQVGKPCDSVIGRHCYEISHNTSSPCYEKGEECAVRHVFETGEPHTTLHKHPDAKGSILYVETKAFPIKGPSGDVISVIETINNITERHLLEEEQLKTQKLEAIGTLAGGIAHDFNNLLQGVFGYISMAKKMHDQKQRSFDMLQQAEKALHMSVNLTSQLLTFSKGGKPLTKRITLQPVIENSVKFALSGSRVDSRIKVDKEIWTVEADEGQIGQVIQNLVLNAEQAMPMGGTITITANNVSFRHKEIPASLQQGNYIVMSIKDSGIGIPEQYLPKIFDPYFTTKDKGSGLGLATSYSIIKNHGGVLEVKSKLGEGTTFFVYLPAVTTVETSAVTVSEDVKALRKGRILLMDDEDIVRDIAGIMITSLGHEVEFALDGKEVIDKYRKSMESGKQFDIVIMDLTVRGGMGGEEAIKELREIDPHIKAIVSSGYTDSSAISEYKTIGFKACLTKPYDIDSLNGILNTTLA